MRPDLHIGIAGPFTVPDLLPLLPTEAADRPWRSTGSPLLTTLAVNLLQRGARVTVFTNDEGIEHLPEPWLRFAGDRLTLYVTPRRRRGWRFVGGRPGRMLDFFALERRGLADAMRDAGPDIVHAHWSYEYAAAALATRLPTLVTCHDAPWIILRHMPDLYRLFRLLMAQQVLRKARHLTVVSPYLVEPIARMTRGRIRLNPNPTARWIFELHTGAARTAPRPGSELRLGMLLNGWNARKNPEPAMQAMTIIARQHPLAKMHLFGPDYQAGGPAAEWARKRSVSELFVFHGPVPHRQAMHALMEMELLIHPAVEESFGLSVAEAMAIGLPVVGGEHSGAVAWVLGGGGLVVDVRDAQAIADAALRLIGDPALYERCSQEGAQRARTSFSEDSVTDEYLRCYEDVLSGRFETHAAATA